MTSPPVAIALDLGGTQVRGALVDSAGRVERRTSVATAATAGAAAVLQQLCEVAAEVSRDVPRARIAGVGMSSPGPLDTVAGVALNIPTIVGFSDFPLRRALEERLALPVWLENDGIAAALGEWRFGAACGRTNVVYVTVSTGIGGGVIADGRVLRGRKGLAGHIGHMTIVRDGVPCVCGNRGCWEAYGSGTAFARRARERLAARQTVNMVPLDGATVFAAASDGDAVAAQLVNEEADILGIGVAALLHLYSPDIVVLGGGMSANFAMLYPGMHARLQVAAMPAFRETPVVPASLGGDSGLIGAAGMVFAAERPD